MCIIVYAIKRVHGWIPLYRIEPHSGVQCWMLSFVICKPDSLWLCHLQTPLRNKKTWSSNEKTQQEIDLAALYVSSEGDRKDFLTLWFVRSGSFKYILFAVKINDVLIWFFVILFYFFPFAFVYISTGTYVYSILSEGASNRADNQLLSKNQK